MEFKISQYRFWDKTVIQNRRSILALASLLFVIVLFPQSASADEIVYFEDFEDGVFNNCTNANSGITSGSAYSGTKKFIDTDSGDCNANLIASSTGIHTYTFYAKKVGGSNVDLQFEGGESGVSASGVFSIQFGVSSPSEIKLCQYSTCTGSGNSQVLGNWSTSEYTKVQIVQNGDSIVARINDTGSWLGIVSSGGSQTATRLSLEGTERWYIDDFSIYAGDVNSQSTVSGSGGCSTCTRIISTDPAMGEYIATTTTGYMVNATYFVADGANTGSQANDFCNSIFAIRACTTKIQININRADNADVYLYEEIVPASGEQYIQHYFEEINSAGTYWYEIRIYNQ